MRKALLWVALAPLFLIFSSSLFAQPVNDNCTGAINIVQIDGTCNPFTTVGSTFDTHTGSCSSNPENVWFSFTGGPAITITVTGVSGSRPEIVPGQWSGTPCTSTFTELDCASNAPGNWNNISLLYTNPSCAVETYYFYVNRSNAGAITVCVDAPFPPAQDDIDNAALLSGCDTSMTGLSNAGSTACDNGCGDFSILGCLFNDLDNNAATGNASGADVGFPVENDIFWSFCPTTNANYTVNITPTLCNSSSGVQFAAFQGPNSGQLDSLLAGGNSGQDITTSTNFTVNITDFTKGCIFFQIDGFGGTECTFNMSMTCNANCPVSCVLPIILQQFRGESTEGGIRLDWLLPAGQFKEKIVIERMEGEDSFQEIGEVPGSLDSQKEKEGHFLDINPKMGRNLYRLRIFDGNGNSETTNLIAIEHRLEAREPFFISPNPVSESFTLYWNGGSEDEFLFEVYNASGKLVRTRRGVTGQEFRMDTRELPPGIYIYQAFAGPNAFQGKIVLN